MKAVQFAKFGVPHKVARCVEVDDVGAPGVGEVVIEIEAFPINPADLLTIQGRYAVRPKLPALLGAEGVGRITAVGKKVKGVKTGDRVINLGRDNWVQKCRVKHEQVIKVPGNSDVLQLAMLKVNPATAFLLLRNYVQLKAGDWVIQNAANSGVGANLIRLAKAKGIRTANVVRREELIEPLKAIGADVVVVAGKGMTDRVLEQTGNAGIRLAVDAVAGEASMELASCLGDGGTVVNYGLLSGKPCMITAHQTVFRGISLTGFWLAKFLTTTPRKEIEAVYAELLDLVRSGRLRVEVEATYGIEDIQEALDHAAREGRSGKILVTPNGPVS